MRTNNMTVGAAGLVCLLSSSLAAQSWILPEGMALKDAGPRTYRFIVDHTVTDTTVRSSSDNGCRVITRAGFRVAMRSGRKSRSPSPTVRPRSRVLARSVSSWRASATVPAQQAWTRP